MAKINFGVGFKVDNSGLTKAKKELEDIKKTLDNKQMLFKIDATEIEKTKAKVSSLQEAMRKALDVDTGVLNMKKLNKELSKTGTSLDDVRNSLNKYEITGVQAFQEIQRSAMKAGTEVKKQGGIINDAFETLAQTARWNLASGAINNVMGQAQRAIGFMKGLDESLTQIRIVTGKSSAEMKTFADNANEAAKNLGRTTTEYTDASLIYFQQGKNAKEVEELTKATLVGANVTGMDTAETAEMLTAVMNGYQLEATKAMDVTDKLAAVGAATGSDFEEMAEAMSKVASQANNAGVGIDQLGGMISTVATVTREDASIIGTSFKTILGRLGDIKLGKKSEGWDTGQVEAALNNVGMTILDQNGKLKEAGEILDELGSKWNLMTKDAQVGVAKQIAGLEQYNRLVALMDNWAMYQDALNVSMNSSGAALEQNAVRADSFQTKLNRLQTEFERLTMAFEGEDTFGGLIEGGTKVVGVLADMVEGLGGLDSILQVTGGIAMNVFSKQLSKSAADGLGKIVEGVEGVKKAFAEGAPGQSKSISTEEANALEAAGKADGEYGEIALKYAQQRIDIRREEQRISKLLTGEEMEAYGQLKNQILKEQANLEDKVAEYQKARQEAYARFDNNEDIQTAGGRKKKKVDLESDKSNRKRELDEEQKLLNEITRIQQTHNGQRTEFNKLLNNSNGHLKDFLNRTDLNTEGMKKGAKVAKRLEEITSKLKEDISSANDELVEYAEDLKALEILEGDEKLNPDDSYLKDLEAEKSKIVKQAEMRKTIDMTIKSVGVAIGAFGALSETISVYTDATVTAEEKTNALSAGMTSLGGVLMSTGNPYAMLAGVILSASGAAYKWIKSNFGVQKLAKDNAKALDDYKQKMEDLDVAQNNLNNTLKDMNTLEEMSAKGLSTTEDLEKYKSIISDIAKSTPEAVAYYDAYGNAVLKTRKEVEKYNEELAKARQLEIGKMETRSGDFGAEISYTLTTEQDRKEEIEKKLATEQKKLNDMLTGKKDGDADDIQKARDKVLEYQTQLEEINKKFQEMGKYAQEAVVDPFVQGQEVFKKIGPEMQGYVAKLFNPDQILKGIDQIKDSGTYTTAELSDKITAFIDDYKAGVKEVANAFVILGDEAANGDQKAQNIVKVLKTLPTDMQNVIGDALMGMGTVLDEKQIKDKLKDISKFIGTDGKLSIDELKKYMDTQSEEIGKKLADELIAAFELVRLSLMNSSESREITKDLVTDLEKTGRNKDENTGEFFIANQNMVDASEALSNQNFERLAAIMKEDKEVAAFINDRLTLIQENVGFLQYSEEEGKAAEAIQRSLNLMMERQAKQDLFNETLGTQAEILDENLFRVYQTQEGMTEINGAWSDVFEKTSELGENGLFETSLIDLDQEKQNLEELTEYLDGYSTGTEEAREARERLIETDGRLAESAQAVGAAMFDMLKDEKSGLSKLLEITGKNKEELLGLADAAKKGGEGGVIAAKKLQNEMGKLYASMRLKDEEYYKSFKETNKDRLATISSFTGKAAEKYGNLAEYNTDLEAWVTKVGGEEQAERILDTADYLKDQIDMSGVSYDKLVEISGEKMTVMDAAANLALLKSTETALVSAQKAGEGGQDVANSFTASLRGIDDSLDAALDTIENNAEAGGIDLADVLAVVRSRINEYQTALGGAGVKLDTSKLDNFVNKYAGKKGNGLLDYTGGANKRVPKPKPKETDNDLGGTAGGNSGDKGGSSGKDKEKEVEDMEWEEDKYHDINNELERKSKLLDKLKAQQDKLYGKELLDNLAKQKTLLQQQQKLYERKLEMQKQDAKAQADALRAQGVIINSSTGMIENYNQIIAARVAAANALSGEAKEAAIESANQFIEAMEKYEEMVNNTIFETQSAIQESIDAQREIFLQEFDYKINFQIELSDDFQKALEFQKEINDEFEDTSENLEDTSKQIFDMMEKIVNLETRYNEIMNDTSLTDKERIERLEEVSEKLKEAVKDLKKLDEEMVKIFKDGLKEGLDEIKEYVKEYEDLNKELKHMEQMMKLLGKSEDYDMILDLQKAEYETIAGRLGYLTKQRDALKEQKKALEEAGMAGTEQWKEIDAAIKQTTTDIDKLTQDAIKNLQDQFKTTVDKIMDSLDKKLTGGMGLDKLKNDLKKRREDDKKYLDTQEKVLAITKLQSKIQKEIDSTEDPAKKAKLQKFMDKELKRLREKDKLTKYDVDRANKLYEIAQKQMALDDLKNSKDTMRLVRDSQGNWVYEFTEDLNAIEKAKNDLSASMEDLYEMDKKNLQSTQDEMIKIQEEYYKEVEQIIKNQLAGKYATQEEFDKAMEEANERYNTNITDANDRYNEAQINLTESTLGTLLGAYESNKDALNGLSKEQQEAIKNLKENGITDFEDLRDAVASVVNGTAPESLKNQIIDAMGEAKDKWNTDITDMISGIVGNEDSLKEITTGAIESIKDAWKEYQGKVESVTEQTGNKYEDMKDRIDDITDATESLNGKTDEAISKFEKEMEAVIEITKAYEKYREEVQKTIDKYGELIGKIDAAIKKKKEEASGITTSGGKPNGSGSGGGSGNKPAPSKPSSPPPAPPKPAPPSLKKGSQVKVKSGRTWYYDSYGKAPSGSTTPYANSTLQITAVNNGGSKPFNVGKYPGNYLGWLTKSDIVGYDTGGYTGQWGKEGKMAFLHEKEIVLNKEDTKNILDTVKTVRGDKTSSSLVHITNAILETSIRTLETLRNAVGSMVSTPTIQPRQEENMEQVVNINADFSGVRSADEIEKAFDNMANMASQYIHRR